MVDPGFWLFLPLWYGTRLRSADAELLVRFLLCFLLHSGQPSPLPLFERHDTPSFKDPTMQ